MPVLLLIGRERYEQHENADERERASEEQQTFISTPDESCRHSPFAEAASTCRNASAT
jgi:hypothetical protein